jgi:hypothetical protein
MSFQKPQKKTVDPVALEEFANGAAARRDAINGPQVPSATATAVAPRPVAPTKQTEPPASKPSPAKRATSNASPEARLTEQLLYRLTPAEKAEIQFVYENTNVKSQQKLLESIIQPAIKKMADKLRHGG